MTLDPIRLLQDLVRCPSVTPEDAGALSVVEAVLRPLGFTCHRLTFDDGGRAPIENLYARIGTGAPNFCFAGHTDVVPPGDVRHWTHDPFDPTIVDGLLYGRGASDMKGGVAAFIVAAGRYIHKHGAPAKGSISLLITGDEEGESINGTKKVLEWLASQGETLDACLVGEPTNPETMADMIKIGRRGSMTAFLTVEGVQGHTAYPHRADNPMPRLVRMLAGLTEKPLDNGTEHFPPSNLEITTIDVGNPANNVIPGQGKATVNIRFNDLHSSSSLAKWIREVCDGIGGSYTLDFKVSGESFLTPPGPLSDLVAGAVERVVGTRPSLSTTGGTSDARFIRAYSPVVEYGIVGQTMHKVDEHIRLSDLHTLTEVYEAVLDDYFATEQSP